MAIFRWDMVFRYLSGGGDPLANNDTGDWSESVYWSDASAQTRRDFKSLCQKRAALLPTYSRIHAIRVTAIDPAGGSATERVNFPGAAITLADTPWQAVAFYVNGTGVANVSRRVLAAVPDKVLVNGEYLKSDPWNLLLGQYVLALRGWLFRGHDLTIPKQSVKTIDALGNVETNADITLAAGNEVKLFKVKLADNSLLSGRYKVETATDFRHFKLRNWRDGAATGGDVQRWVYIYPPIAPPTPIFVKPARRPIGRPSGGYRARRSRRRVKRPTV